MKEIQRKLGLKDDGVLGPITSRAIRDYLKLSNTEAAHFLGQCMHESAGFTKMREEFHRYTEQNLLDVFGRYFRTVNPRDFVGHPEKIANWVYANRMGNGSPESGDGWKFRGAGPLQLTGKNNFELFSSYAKDPEIMKNTDLVATDYQLESAKFFFDRNNIWRRCRDVSDDTILVISRMVNLGDANSRAMPNHLPDRVFQTKRVWHLLTKN
jgi:putative chitinase